MDARDGFDRVFAALPASRAYRDSARAAAPEFPPWLVPYNGIGGDELGRIARETGVGPEGSFVDLACGTGGCGLWIAQETGAALTGVDFSAAAIAAATAAFDAVVCIDALVFMDAQRAAAEIARLLRKGGRLVATTWETLHDETLLPGMVGNYEPAFDSAGLRMRTHDVLAGWRERLSVQYRALIERENALRDEMGDAASDLLAEARDGIAREGAPPRVRKVFLVAERL